MKNILTYIQQNFSIDFLLLFFYCLISLTPNFGSIDKSISQWVYISLLNVISLLYISYNFKSYKIYTSLNKSLLFIAFSIFIVSILISFFQAFNIVESIIKFSHWFNLYCAFIIFFFLISKTPRKLLIATILLIFTVQLYFTYDGYFKLLEFVKFDFSYSSFLKGVTGNKNITATLFGLTIPFIYFLLLSTKRIFFSILLSFFLVCAFYAVFILGARTSYVIIGFLILAYIFAILHYYFRSQKNRNFLLLSLFKLFIPFLLSLIIFSNFEGNSNSIQIQDRAQTINVDDESVNIRIKFYKLALEEFSRSPITGIGAGNWKIKSVDLYKKNIDGYIAPYHVHNDFLEVAVETGLLGLIPFILIFLSILIYTRFSIIRSKSFTDFIFNYTLLIIAGLYVIDSLLNFPHARPVISIFLMMILSLISLEYFKSRKHE